MGMLQPIPAHLYTAVMPFCVSMRLTDEYYNGYVFRHHYSFIAILQYSVVNVQYEISSVQLLVPITWLPVTERCQSRDAVLDTLRPIRTTRTYGPYSRHLRPVCTCAFFDTRMYGCAIGCRLTAPLSLKLCPCPRNVTLSRITGAVNVTFHQLNG